LPDLLGREAEDRRRKPGDRRGHVDDIEADAFVDALTRTQAFFA
jgi:hypothetical protein